MTINQVFRKDKVNSEGMGPIILMLTHKGIPYRVATKEKCHKDAWDFKKDRVKSNCTGADELNERLRLASIALKKIYRTQEASFSIDEIRELFKKYLENPAGFDVKKASDELEKNAVANMEREEFDKITKTWDKGRWKSYRACTAEGIEFFMAMEKIFYKYAAKWDEKYIGNFISLRSKILRFDPNFKPTMFSETMWMEFIKHCTTDKEHGGEGNGSNTVSKDVKLMRVTVRELRKQGYVIMVDEDSIEWSYIEPKIEGSVWETALRIGRMDLSQHEIKTLEPTRIWYFIGCLLGRRLGELMELSRVNFYQAPMIVDGKTVMQWRYTNLGKGQKMIDVPLLPEAVEFIVEKLDFQFPQRVNPKIMNIDIKTIYELLGETQETLKITPIDKNRAKKEVVPANKLKHFHCSRHIYGLRVSELYGGDANGDKQISYMLGHASPQTSWKYRNQANSVYDQAVHKLFVKKEDARMLQVG